MLVHSAGRPFSGLVMAPPHLVEKWAREAFLTLPNIRVFLIDDMRNGGNPREPHGINEVRLRRGEIVREGMHTTLTELRRLGRSGWRRLCPATSIFCIGREKAKLSYFWKHCYGRSRSGPYLGALTNPDTGCPIETDGVRLTALTSTRNVCTRQWIPQGWDHPILRALAGGPHQDCPHGARPNTWAATCTSGGTTPLQMRFTSWPAIQHKETRSEC